MRLNLPVLPMLEEAPQLFLPEGAEPDLAVEGWMAQPVAAELEGSESEFRWEATHLLLAAAAVAV